MNNYRRPQDIPQPIHGLLPWQSCFLACVAGLFGYKYPLPAAVALVLLLVVDTLLRGWLHRISFLVFLFCAVFGFGYASQRGPEPVSVPAWVEARQKVEVRGVVHRVESRMGGKLRVILRDVECLVDGRIDSLPGNVVWNWRKPDRNPVPGQIFSARMRVVPVRSFGNPGGWDYAWFWQRQDVNWRAWPIGKNALMQWGEPPSNWWWRFKNTLRESVAEKLLGTDGGAMVLALVTGDKSKLTKEIRQTTQRAGLAHTLALSGLHVGFVAAFGLGLAWGFGLIYPPLLLSIPRPQLAVVLGAPLVIGYMALGQPSQSLVRATIMFAFWGILYMQGRNRVLMDGLFFALCVIVFLSPFAVFDLSLQMSAMAVAGIGLLYPVVHRLFSFGQGWHWRVLSWGGRILGISICANLALLPLISWNFGTWTPNILLNILWLPVLGFGVMPLGLLGVLLSPFAWAAPLSGLLLGAAAMVMDWLLTILGAVDGAGLLPIFSVLRPLWPEIFGGVLLLILAVVSWVNKHVNMGLAALGFLLLAGPQVYVLIQDAQDRVSLKVLDVGQAQSVLVSTPGGHRWLIDGGGGGRSFDMGESVVAPALTYGRPPRLDGVFMSHPDTDHSYGLPFILSRFEVDDFYTNGTLPRRKARTGDYLRAVLEERQMTPVSLKAGDVVVLDTRTQIQVVHPAKGYKNGHANEKSLVLRLVRDGQPLALIPGDVESDGVDAILASGNPISADVLVLPHHGSKTTYVPEFYDAVSPSLAVCSNGYLNRYGFPHELVRDGIGVPLLTTAEKGQITVFWDKTMAQHVTSYRH